MSIEITGAVACVTGAARGIGLATAALLAERGARVFLGDLDGESAAEAAADLGGGATGVELDVADPASFAAFVAQARKGGPIDLLVNNAGIMRTGDFAQQEPAAQMRELDVNLGGVITGMRLVLPDMLAADRGHIVNVASMAGKITTPAASVYAASKFGVVALSRAVRAEIADSQVTISTVLPAAVDTELTDGLDLSLMPVSSAPDVARAIADSCTGPRAEIGIPRWVTPIAQLVESLPEGLGEHAKRLGGARRRIAPDNQAARAYQERL